MSHLSPRDLLAKVVMPVLAAIGIIIGIVGGLAQIFDFVGQGKATLLLIAAGVSLAISLAIFVTLCAPSTHRKSVALASILLLVAGAVTWFGVQSVLSEPVSRTPPESMPTTQPQATPTLPPTSYAVGRITSPLNNAQVPIEVSVSGAAARIASDHELRVFVEFIEDRRFFPSEGAILLQSDGQWTVQMNVGGADQAGQRFKLNLADLGPTAIERMQAYFRTEREIGKALGLSRDELDALGVKFLDAVTVNRT